MSQISDKRLRLFRLILIGIVAVTFAVGLLGAEWAARTYERHRSRQPDYFPQMYYPHQRLSYGLVPNFDYYGWFRINSLGFRGPEVRVEKDPQGLRIVCLGGSTTFDIGSIGNAKPWPQVLEDELRRRFTDSSIEVLNLGIPGSTSLDSFIDLQMRVLQLQPDLLIVYQGLNDVIFSVPPPRVNTELYPLESAPRSSFIRWLRIHSVLYAKTEGKLTVLIRGLFNGSGEDRVPVTVDDPYLARGLRNFHSNVSSIAAIAHANGVPVVLPEVVLPFPQGAGADCDVCANLSGTLNLDPLVSRTLFLRYSAALAEIAESQPGVHVIATAGVVPSEDRYYHDPVHFGPEGSVRMGVAMAEAITPLIASLKEVRDLDGEPQPP